jgi:hypothetical protein
VGRYSRPLILNGAITAIEVGKQIAAIIPPICEAGLFVYAFDSIAYPINANGTELSHWEYAFRGINASGNTACGAALHMMRMKKHRTNHHDQRPG